jgi:hypothetical protein
MGAPRHPGAPWCASRGVGLRVEEAVMSALARIATVGAAAWVPFEPSEVLIGLVDPAGRTARSVRSAVLVTSYS